MIRQQLRLLYYRRNYVLILVCILLGFEAESQSEKLLLISLNKEAPAKHDSIYYELFKLTRSSNEQKASLYYQKAYNLSRDSHHTTLHINLCYDVADWYDLNNKPDSATVYFHRAIQTSSSHGLKDWLIYLYNDLGLFHQRLDLYDSALHYFINSHNLACESHASKAQAVASHNIGLVYYHLENFKESSDYFTEAIQTKLENGITQGLNRAIINLARVLNVQGLYERAYEELQKVKMNCSNDCDDFILADLYYEFGYTNLMQNKISTAHDFFSKALDHSRANDNRQTTANSLYYLSSIAINNQEIDLGLKYMDEAEAIAKEIKHRRLLRDIYHQLSAVYYKINENDKAIRCENLYMHLRDSIFNINIANNVKNIQLAEQRKQSDIIITEKQTELWKSYSISILLFIVFVLTCVVVYLIYRSLRDSRLHRDSLRDEIMTMLDDHENQQRELFQSHLELTATTSRINGLIKEPLSSMLRIAKNFPNETQDVNNMIKLCENTLLALEDVDELILCKNLSVAPEAIDINSLTQEVNRNFKKVNSFLLLTIAVHNSVVHKVKTDRTLLLAAINHAILYFDYNNHNPIVELILEQSDCGGITKFTIKHSLVDSTPLPHKNQLNQLTVMIAARKLNGSFMITQRDDHTAFEIYIPTDYTHAENKVGKQNISME